MNNPFSSKRQPAPQPEPEEPHRVPLAAWQAVVNAAAQASFCAPAHSRPVGWGLPTRDSVPSAPTRAFLLHLVDGIRAIRTALSMFPNKTYPAWANAIAALHACEAPMQEYATALKKMKAMERLGMR